jgi:uncharacterized protein (DUF2126 family)
MLISSGTGMALDAGVGRYRGFALLAIAMTGKQDQPTEAEFCTDKKVSQDRLGLFMQIDYRPFYTPPYLNLSININFKIKHKSQNHQKVSQAHNQ